MHVGIDFGTTNSSVAHFDGERLRPIQLDPGNDNEKVLPSLIYIKRDFEALLGSHAAAAYLQHETGRRPIWERRRMGAIEMIVGGPGSSPIEYMHDIYDMVDIAAQGRLLQSIKTALRDPEYEGTNIFDRYYTIDELIAVFLQAMKRRAESQLETECSHLVLGRPVRFSDDPDVSLRAEEILYKAARFAGFDDITFQLEPIAAAYLYHRSSTSRELAFIFDFGGGTLDLTVAEVGGAERPQVLATRGVLVGGDDLDRRIMESLLHHFGAGSQITPGVNFPFHMLDMLKSWQTMPYLSRPEPLGKIREYQRTGSDPRAMRALETLVSENLGFALFKIIERTKIELSETFRAPLTFLYKAIQIREKILRSSFEKMIAEELAQVEQEIQAVLRDASVRPEEINVVLRTGGSALVPAFVDMLCHIFGGAKIRDMDPLTSVVGGMAIVAHEKEGREPGPYARHYQSPLTALHAESGKAYESTVIRAYRPCYTDRDYVITRLPLALSGLHGVRTADLDYRDETAALLHLKLTRPTRVYVIYSALANALPEWLRSYQHQAEMLVEIETPGGRMPFFVYSQDLTPGPVTLGGPRADGYRGTVFMNYLVAFKPL